MKNNFIFKIYVALASLAGLAHLAIAGEDDISPQVLAKLILWPHTSAVIATESSSLYAAPDATSPVTATYSWTDQLSIDTQKMATAPSGWIPVKGQGEKSSVDGKYPSGSHPDSWMRRRDLAILGDYQNVVGCWPIHTASFDRSGYMAFYTFKPDGSASVEEWWEYDGYSGKKVIPKKAHIRMARNVVVVEGKSVYELLGYRPSVRKLYSHGSPAQQQTFFPEAKLKGCETGPQLAP